MSEPTIKDVLKAVDQLLDRTRPLPDRSWTLEDFAAYAVCSVDTARRMSNQPRFPKPSKPQTNDKGSRLPPRYDAEEIKDWFWSSANRAS